MSPLLSTAARARAARRHLQAAQELEARWRSLSPEERSALQAEIDVVKRIATEVQQNVTFGVRGFMHEFKAAKDGREAEPMAQARPLTKSVPDLVKATLALKAKLDAKQPQPGQ